MVDVRSQSLLGRALVVYQNSLYVFPFYQACYPIANPRERRVWNVTRVDLEI